MAEKSRRKLLKGLGISIPTAQAAPIIEAVILPAHASTSGCSGTFCTRNGPTFYTFTVEGSSISLEKTGPGSGNGSGELDGNGDFGFERTGEGNNWIEGTVSGCSSISWRICEGSRCGEPSEFFAALPENCVSDHRLKSGIERIVQFGGVDFYRWRWNSLASEAFGLSGSSVGVIAQEVAQVFPDVIARRGEFLAVDYKRLLNHLIR